jgi:glycosyltransferase involved in cell wall biosynthesis
VNILLVTAHSIASYDDVRMLTDLGHDVFNLDAYIDPANPHVDTRPPLFSAPRHPELMAVVDALGRPDNLTAAKERIPDELLEWADVAIFHHYLDRWMVPNWTRMRAAGVRVIWRTCGQSDFALEDLLTPYVRDGLDVVRYSPAERRFFEPAGHWAGETALIRFGKYREDHPAWTGPWGDATPFVANVTQDMAGRGEWCGLTFWTRATAGLNAAPAGPGSEKLPGGIGALPYPAMLQYLSQAAAYLYTGTMPASYTLGLIEALMVGTPVVSIGPGAWLGPDELFEAAELVRPMATDSPEEARQLLRELLTDHELGLSVSRHQHPSADPFDVVTVGAQWQELLKR